MKKILVINKVWYLCPTSWEEITLRQQLKVNADALLIQNDAFKKISILSGYAGIPVDVLKRIPIAELTELFKSIDFVNTSMPIQQITEIVFKDEIYYVSQNLLEIEFQDFISIENIVQANSGNTYNALPVIIAIMAKKKRKDGTLETIDDYDIMQRAEMFKDLPLTTINSISVFFYNYANGLQIATASSSIMEKGVEMRIKEVENILKQSDGKGWLTRCANGIFRYWLKLIKLRQTKHSTSTQAK